MVQQLSMLETEASLPLPERAGRRVRLTPAALSALDAVRRALTTAIQARSAS